MLLCSPSANARALGACLTPSPGITAENSDTLCSGRAGHRRRIVRLAPATGKTNVLDQMLPLAEALGCGAQARARAPA
jgi:hypothetical protein